MVNIGMELLGKAAFIKSIDDTIEAFGGASNGYRVYTDVDHAYYQEYGTIYHGPQPHFRPAVDAAGSRMGSTASGAASLDDLMNKTADELLSEVRRRAPVATGELRGSYTKESL